MHELTAAYRQQKSMCALHYEALPLGLLPASSAKLGDRAPNSKTWQAWSEDGPWWNTRGQYHACDGGEDMHFLPNEAI